MGWLYIKLNNTCYLYIYMIEIGCNFLKKDLNKIRKFKNPTLDIDRNRINKNSIYKIFLNKNQYILNQ